MASESLLLCCQCFCCLSWFYAFYIKAHKRHKTKRSNRKRTDHRSFSFCASWSSDAQFQLNQKTRVAGVVSSAVETWVCFPPVSPRSGNSCWMLWAGRGMTGQTDWQALLWVSRKGTGTDTGLTKSQNEKGMGHRLPDWNTYYFQLCFSIISLKQSPLFFGGK